MPSGFQQAFAGNNTYHQSLAAAALPQYKNSVSVSSLPQSAAVPSAYGPFGSSTSIPANYPMNPPAGPAGATISYEDLLSSQYKDSSHLISLQQVHILAHGNCTLKTSFLITLHMCSMSDSYTFNLKKLNNKMISGLVVRHNNNCLNSEGSNLVAFIFFNENKDCRGNIGNQTMRESQDG